jgi:hypothetical protein
LTKDVEVQKITMYNLQLGLKGKVEVQELKVKGKENIRIEVLDKIYNHKYK